MDIDLLIPRALASSLLDASVAGAMGVLLSALWRFPARQAHLEPTLHTTLRLCAVGLVLVLPYQLWLLASTMLGGGPAFEIARQIPEILTATHAGRVLIPAFALALLLLVTALARPLQRRGTILLGLAIVLMLAAVRATSGHAASDGEYTVRELLQFVHLSAMAVWAGGVTVAGLIVVPHLPPSDIAGYGRKLSRAAIGAVLLVTLSGLYSAYRGLGPSLHPLAHTQWGALLLAKIFLVLTALSLGAVNRFNLAKPLPDLARFATLIRIEAILMLGILLLSGFLANSPPVAEL